MRLAQTATTDDVMRIVVEFVHSKPADFWPRLPRDWRPRPMFTADHVAQYAISLVTNPKDPSHADEAETYELIAFFCAASQRFAFILSAAVAGRRRNSRAPAAIPRVTPGEGAARSSLPIPS